jgi:hypothetical protein
VPDDLTVAMIEKRLSEPDAARLRARRLRATRAGRSAGQDARQHGRGLDAILFFDLPDEVGSSGR